MITVQQLHNLFPEIRPFYLKFKEDPSIRIASTIGNGIASSFRMIEQKKLYFAHLFEIIENDEIEAVINAWAVPVMLEDTLPVEQKIQAFRALFADPTLESDILNAIVRFIIVTRRIPDDLFEFLSSEIKHSSKINEEIKELLD